MAFTLPSYNAAVANAQSSGLALQRLQAGIDFGDVNVDYATKMLGKQSLEEFITEANIAKQALNQFGASVRNRETLDYNRDVLEAEQEQIQQNRSDARRGKLYEMLGGGLNMLGNDLLGGGRAQRDPREEFGTELLFRKARDQYLQDYMGGLNPSYGQSAVIEGLGQFAPQVRVPGAGTNKQIEGVYQIRPTAPPKLKVPQATTFEDVVKQINALGSVGSPAQ
ncbi:MAG: hypothetical protein CBD74_06040 [Saprospirales bacterium TMED214]|nr:MAG: hypothetical protein CBD74_06040 [Saprospirales bacterium TMED214]